MKIYRGTSGILKRTYNFKLTLAKLQSKTFLCARIIKLDNNIIKRVIESRKFLIGDLIQGENTTNLSYEFAKQNNFNMSGYGLSKNSDYCGIYAFKNVVDGKSILEMCLIKTFKDENSTSISLYYIPRGDIRDLTFVARICKHKNVHINSDGKIIPKNTVHIHTASEKQFDDIYNKQKSRGEKVVLEKLQSPDAKELTNVSGDDMEQFAKEFFNISDKVVESCSADRQKKKFFIRGEKIIYGNSDQTLVDEISKGMDM